MTDVRMRSVLMNGRWNRMVPEYRAFRWVHADHEKERLASMFLNLRGGDRVLDVGAEDGDISALIASWVQGGPEETGGMFLVEANPDCWPIIKATFEANGLGPPLGSHVGLVGRDRTMNPRWYARGVWPQECDRPFVGDHPMAVHDGPMTALNVSGWSRRFVDGAYVMDGVTAVTIDVEGVEYDVLKGMRSILKTRPLVWVSIHPQIGDGRRRQRRVLSLMEEYGYRAIHLADDHESHWMFEPKD